MIDHRSYAVVKLKPEKKKHSCLNGIRTHDLCDTGAVLYQVSYQANWELVMLWVRRNIPADGEEYKITAMINHVFISFSAVQVYDLSHIHLK